MAKAVQKVTGKTRFKIKTSNAASKTRVKGGKKGNPNRCPACGRFI